MTTVEKAKISQNEYQKRCQLARQEFAQRPVVKEIFTEEVEPKLLELFMIHWSALSAGLTEPIPVYLERAGERCKNMGFQEMAEFFYEHEEEEDGHDNWAMEDVEKLVPIWNRKNPNLSLDARKLLANKFSPAVKRYHKLHEEVIEGNSPWAELAIDVEIELFSATYGPILVKKWVDCMGEDSLSNISFLHKHVLADVGHSEANFEVVDKFISKNPQSINTLVGTATKALNSYADFLEDAMEYAKKIYVRL